MASVDIDGTAVDAINRLLKEAIDGVASVHSEMTRPSVLYRPQLSYDGNLWQAKYGDYAAVGNTPRTALGNFDLGFTTTVGPRNFKSFTPRR